MEYIEFLKTKQTAVITSGFEIGEEKINSKLFPFQKYCVKRALKAGRFALFEDCGLGKTIQQLEWADKVQNTLISLCLFLPLLGLSGKRLKRVRSSDMG